MSVGSRIKDVREHFGMSQVALADKIGVSKQTLYKYENDIITNVPSDKIEAISIVLNTSPQYLMGWDTPPAASKPSFTSDKQKELNRIFESLDEESQKALLKYGRYLELESDGLVSDQSGDGDISDDKESSGGIA